MIALAVALVLAGDHPNDTVVGNYILCVRRMAVRLEPSGESPMDIADAAKAYCPTARTAGLNSSRDVKGGTAISIGEMESGASFSGRSQVVVTRLCRKTKDCGLTSIP